MKRILAAAALTIALSAPAAHATEYGDLLCHLHDIGDNNLYYTFNGNSWNVDNSFGGTMVETGFSKNGKSVISNVGQRPIWTFNENVAHGMNLHSREAPGWTLSLTNIHTVNGMWNSDVTLTKDGRFIGGGVCARPVSRAQTSATVGDLGN